jgi:hypothetical protein
MEYYELVGANKVEPAESLSDDEILQCFPTRLSVPVQMMGDEITIPKGPRILRLNGLGSRIFSLCSGKLRVSDIISELRQELNRQAPADAILQADVLEFVRHLDKNFAVFLKDF